MSDEVIVSKPDENDYEKHKNVILYFLFLLSASMIPMFAFTAGYIDAFKVPVVPGLSESTYFFVYTFISSLAKDYTDIYVYILVFVALLIYVKLLFDFDILDLIEQTIKKRKSIHKYYVSSITHFKSLGRLQWSSILFLSVIGLNFFLSKDDVSYTIVPWFTDIQIYYPYDQNVFIFTSQMNIVLFVVALVFLKVHNSPILERLLLILIAVYSIMSSYLIANKYSPYYMNLPEIRLNEKTDLFYKLVWSTDSKKIVLDCRFRAQVLVMEKEDEATTKYVNIINPDVANAACSRKLKKL